MLCVPICIVMLHSIYTYENHIGSALHSKLCCAARAHSPRKHKQIQNVRHDDIVITAECNDKQCLLLGLYLTVCEPEKRINGRAGERVNDEFCIENYTHTRESDVSRCTCEWLLHSNCPVLLPPVNRISCTLIVLFINSTHFQVFTTDSILYRRDHNLISLTTYYS